MDASPGTAEISVLITDDHAIVREGLRLIINEQPEMRVVAEAGDVAGARRHIAEHKPEVVLLDINLAGESGLDAIPSLRAEAPDSAIVVLTMQSDAAYARMALQAGAVGYVVKEAAGHELVRAIRAVAAGQTYVQPELGALLVNFEDEADRDDPLSERELQVLRLLALGHTNPEIAERLYLSVRTVESHRARIQEKLGLAGRAELIRYALDHDLLDR